jgi:hypothetical protein
MGCFETATEGRRILSHIFYFMNPLERINNFLQILNKYYFVRNLLGCFETATEGRRILSHIFYFMNPLERINNFLQILYTYSIL